jgi:hypothetical protein
VIYEDMEGMLMENVNVDVNVFGNQCNTICIYKEVWLFYNMAQKTRAMIDETIINSLMSPLLLHVMFFMMQSVRAP